LSSIGERLAELGYLANDLSSELTSYLAGLETEPGTYEQAQLRLAELGGLVRVHGMPIEQILQWAARASQRLFELSQDVETTTALLQEICELDSLLSNQASAVSATRQRFAIELAHEVTAELHGLGMAGASFNIQMEPAEPKATGSDLVTFALQPRPGGPKFPLAKGASGGELSRVMLALELCLAQKRNGSLPTFVFDEIDAGVGGRAAVEVGKRLSQLAQSTQVIVVTHLPQVAAYGDTHFVITKTGAATAVSLATENQREREIARMLSGSEDSPTALTHARELLTSRG
jgi:DNA repair protein RecN (Recombination protein N)